MIGEVLEIIMGHPVLAFIFTVDVVLIAFILGYIALHFYWKERPDRKIALLFKKFTVKIHPSGITSIEDLYSFVIDLYLKKGVISPEEGRGFLAREKILNSISGKEKEVIEAVFEAYEKKIYGGGLENEERVVSALLSAVKLI